MSVSERTAADSTADLLLRCYREPSRYRNEMRRADAPTADPEVVLRLALGRAVDFSDPALTQPRVASELKDAAALFVQQMFFRPDATPYQVLGVEPDASQETIKETYRLLMQLVHPDRQDESVFWPETFAAQVNRAYGVLRDPESRAAHDREAEARAARAAAARRAEASGAPVAAAPTRRHAPAEGRLAPTRPLLPEWLTAGVGGFALRHPAFTAFATLIVVSVLAVVAVVPERDGVLPGDHGPASPQLAKRGPAERPRVASSDPTRVDVPARVAAAESDRSASRDAVVASAPDAARGVAAARPAAEGPATRAVGADVTVAAGIADRVSATDATVNRAVSAPERTRLADVAPRTPTAAAPASSTAVPPTIAWSEVQRPSAPPAAQVPTEVRPPTASPAAPVPSAMQRSAPPPPVTSAQVAESAPARGATASVGVSRSGAPGAIPPSASGAAAQGRVTLAAASAVPSPAERPRVADASTGTAAASPAVASAAAPSSVIAAAGVAVASAAGGAPASTARAAEAASTASTGASAARAEQVAMVATPTAPPPAAPEIEAFFDAFVNAYEAGRLDAFAALFDEDADTNFRRGRAAIRSEYEELFRLSTWRKMQLRQVNWKRAGDRAYAKGEIAVKIGWRDGREVEQRVAIDMELVRRDGRTVIAKLSHQPKN